MHAPEHRRPVLQIPAALLSVSDLTLAFGGVKALNGVGFEVQPGSITSLIGPNGAGKTSVFNTLSGFYRPSAGTITFDGRDIGGLPPPQRAAAGMARSFQNIALFRGMTVLGQHQAGSALPPEDRRPVGACSTHALGAA